MGFFSDLISGIGEVVTAPVKWAGDIVEKTGEVTGIDALHNLGEGVSDFAKNPQTQMFAGLAAGLAAGYYGPGALSVFNASTAAGASTTAALQTALTTTPEAFGLTAAAAPAAAAAVASGGTIPAGTSGAAEASTWLSSLSKAAPYIAGTALLAGSSLYGADKAAGATEEAANTAAGAQNAATALADKIYDQTRADFQPYADVGKAAIPQYQSMLNGTYDMKESPAAQYELQMGTRALNRSLASRGLSGSGNAVQRLTELNQNVAAKDWNNQYSRILDALKLGTGASSSMGQAGQNNVTANQTGATNLGNIAVNQGNNQASLYAGQTGNLANIAATGLNAYKTFNPSPTYNYNINPNAGG